MSDFSVQSRTTLPLFVHTGSVPESCQADFFPITGSTGVQPAARTWVANLINYTPVTLKYAYPVNRVFWINGSTITSTNVDMGIYTADGVRIYNTGSTAMSGASSVQYVTPSTTFVLAPGDYYFAWSCNNTTSRGMAFGGAANAGRVLGLVEQTPGGFGLPATMTPVAWARAWGASMCGVTRTTTGF